MAYVNVLEWKAEQVSEWLRGLDDSIFPYAHFFLNNNITGQGLLNLTVDDLYKLHVEKLGHQELILESLELLKQLHFSLDQENLQYVALKLSCKARSLYNEIQMRYPPPDQGGGGGTSGMGQSSGTNTGRPGKQEITGAVMSQVGDVLDSVRCLLSWLERKPFESKEEFYKVRTTLIGLSLELATNTHREAFAEQPIDVIRVCCDKLGELSDQVIQQVRDPLLLQPASLDVATLRKKADEELGIVVEGQTQGVHLVTEVNVIMPSARIQPGDEIVQVNYQTVVGWQTKKVIALMGENPGEVILTLKKRPKHANLMGQVYMKPFRIPARKKSSLFFNNLPSPRTELLVVPDLSIPIPKKRQEAESGSSGEDESHLSEEDNNNDESDSENDEAFLPVVAAQVADQIEGRAANAGTASPTSSLRSVLSRPRSAPQRRATISGTLPRSRPYINVGESMMGANGGDTSLLEISYSTLSSQDSGVSTMSAKQEFTMRQRADTNTANTRPITLAAPPSFHQVTSAPNLHSLPDSRLNHRKNVAADDSFESDAAILENVEYKNGSLNIEVKSPVSDGGKSPRSLPPTNSSPPRASGDSPHIDRMSGERIVLKVCHAPQTSSYNTHSTVVSGSTDGGVLRSTDGGVLRSQYVNVPGTSEQKMVHPYVNITNDLVLQSNSNPLPKPRTPKPSSVSGSRTSGAAGSSGGARSSSPPPVGGVSPPPTPSPGQSPASTGSRTGKRPIPLPRRVSTSGSEASGSRATQRQRSNTTAGFAVSGASRTDNSGGSGPDARQQEAVQQQYTKHQDRLHQQYTKQERTVQQYTKHDSPLSPGDSKGTRAEYKSTEGTRAEYKSTRAEYKSTASTRQSTSQSSAVTSPTGSSSRGQSSRQSGGGSTRSGSGSTRSSGGSTRSSSSTRRENGSGNSNRSLANVTQITPTSNYKSYRRCVPGAVQPVRGGPSSPAVRGGGPAPVRSPSSPPVRATSTSSISPVHESQPIRTRTHKQQQCSGGWGDTSLPTRLDDQGYVEISEIVGSPAICEGKHVVNSPPPPVSSVYPFTRLPSVSSTDSGLADSLSPTSPISPKPPKLGPPPILPPAPSSVPALPPRRHPSTSS